MPPPRRRLTKSHCTNNPMKTLSLLTALASELCSPARLNSRTLLLNDRPIVPHQGLQGQSGRQEATHPEESSFYVAEVGK